MDKIAEWCFLGVISSKTLILYHKIMKILQKTSEFREIFENFFFPPKSLKMVQDNQKITKIGDFSE